MSEASSLATVVVVPRERFSTTPVFFDGLLANTADDVALVYVEGGGPGLARDAPAFRHRRGRVDVVRREHYLSPNEARNLGFAHVDTKYAAFIDNDVVVEPGWLEALVAYAEETGAEVVGPLYLDGDPAEAIIHMAGGEARIREAGGITEMFEEHRYRFVPVKDVEIAACRGPTDVVEFHCMLVESAFLRSIGGFDEGFLNTREHVDFCLGVQKAGGAVHLEPATRVAYALGASADAPPPPMTLADVPYYLLRWSEAWSRATFAHADRKWGLTEDHQRFFDVWLTPHRRRPLMPVRRWARRLLGARLGDRSMDGAERAIARWGERRRRAAQASSDRKSSNLPPASRGISST